MCPACYWENDADAEVIPGGSNKLLSLAQTCRTYAEIVEFDNFGDATFGHLWPTKWAS